MTRYRKRPHEVDALRFDGTDTGGNRIGTWCNKPYTLVTAGLGRWSLQIGTTTAWPGDWVILRDGEVYAMPHELFVENYDAITP